MPSASTGRRQLMNFRKTVEKGHSKGLNDDINEDYKKHISTEITLFCGKVYVNTSTEKQGTHWDQSIEIVQDIIRWKLMGIDNLKKEHNNITYFVAEIFHSHAHSWKGKILIISSLPIFLWLKRNAFEEILIRRPIFPKVKCTDKSWVWAFIRWKC